MKKIIRLTESDLHNIIKESVNIVLRESWDNPFDDEERADECPYCGSNDVYQPKQFSIKSPLTYKCDTCGADFDYQDYLDNIQNKGYEPDWDTMRHESYRHHGRLVSEDGEIGGGGATNCVGINVGGAAGQAKNHIDAAPFSNKPLKQKHNLGNPTTKKANMVDITPALDRTPGFSMGTRVGGKKKK